MFHAFAVVNIFLLATLSLLATHADCYKILMMPFGNKSHLIEFHGLGRVLLERGHEVHIYLSRVDPPTSEIANAGYKFVHPSANESLTPLFFKEEDIISRIDKSVLQQLMETREETRNFVAKIKRMAEVILEDEQSIEALRKEKYDFVLVDSMFFLYFMFILPHKLGVPYGGLTALYEPITNRVPAFPSAFHDVGFSSSFGVDSQQLGSSFAHRFKNFVAVTFHELYMGGWAAEAYQKANVTFDQILGQVAFQLIDQNYLLTDPLPTTPHVRMVGGLVTRPANPITDKRLLNFIEGTEHPVIVCSFGSLMGSLTLPIIEKLMSAFRTLPQFRFVMRLKKANLQNVPENLLLLDWLPQNDLLGHNKTALLITHSGNNGQNEALYHGVPMVAFFIFGDQEYNAERVARRGFAVKLNLLQFADHQLVDAIEEVMRNPSYRQRIRKASELFRADNSSGVAADLIEHVIKYGSDHLRPLEALSLSTIQFTMLDVVFFLFTIIAVFLYVSVILLKILLKRICGRR